MESEGILNMDEKMIFNELYCPEVRVDDGFGSDENLLEGLSPRQKHTKSVLKMS